MDAQMFKHAGAEYPLSGTCGAAGGFTGAAAGSPVREGRRGQAVILRAGG